MDVTIFLSEGDPGFKFTSDLDPEIIRDNLEHYLRPGVGVRMDYGFTVAFPTKPAKPPKRAAKPSAPKEPKARKPREAKPRAAKAPKPETLALAEQIYQALTPSGPIPSAKASEIAAALSLTDTKQLRPGIDLLIEQGRIASSGKAKGTTYARAANGTPEASAS